MDGAYVPDPGTTTLTVDGTPITTGPGAGEFPGSGQWTLPPAGATYQLTVEVRRDSPEWRLPTEVTARWTFRSAHVTGDTAQPLPLLDARYQLPADATGSVPVGTAPAITVAIGHQPGTDPGTTSTVTATASLDDGKTWSPLPVRRLADGRWCLTGPAGGTAGTYVSLRLSVTTSTGAALDETVLHAYRLR